LGKRHLEVDFSFRNYFPIVCFSKVVEKELVISLPAFIRELSHIEDLGIDMSDLLSWMIVHETCHALEDDGSSRFESV
jgi:hypothetical protein